MKICFAPRSASAHWILIFGTFWFFTVSSGFAQQTDLSKSPLAGHLIGINSVAYSPDGRWLASGSYDCTIKIWNAETKELVRTLTGHEDGVNSLSFSPDGKRIVSGSSDYTVKIWDTLTGQLLRTLNGHEMGVETVDFSPDGKRVVSGGYDKIRVWNAQSGQLLFLMNAPQTITWSVKFSPNGKRIVSGGANKKDSFGWVSHLIIWNAENGKQVQVLERKQSNYFSNYSVDAVNFIPDVQYIISKSSDSTSKIKVWNVHNGQLIRTMVGVDPYNKTQKQYNVINSIAFSPNGQQIVLGSTKEITIWDAKNGQLLYTLSDSLSYCRSVTFSPDGKKIVWGDQEIREWDIKTGQLPQSFTTGAKGIYKNNINCLSNISPDGRHIIFTPAYNKVGEVLDVQTGKLVFSLIGHKSYVNAVSFSVDGKYIASGSEDRTIKIWNGQTGQLLRTLTGHTEAIKSVAFSLDGNRIVSSTEEAIIVWDTQTGQVLQTIPTKEISVKLVSFSPDGKRIIGVHSYFGVQKIRAWDAQSGQLLTSSDIGKNSSIVKWLNIDSNLSYFICITESNAIEIRNNKTFALIKRYENLGFFTDPNFKAPLTPDGRYEIYPYHQSFFVKEVNSSTQVPPLNVVNSPTINWEIPSSPRQTVNQSSFTVKACAEGTDLSQYQLYLNGVALSSRGFKVTGCPMSINQTVTLKEGQNELYITASNPVGTTTSERRYVTYQPQPSTPTGSSVPVTVKTAQKRLALVIGNAKYIHVGMLPNPVNDAEALRKVLTESGFEVLFYTNLDKKGMVAAIQEFGLRLKEYNVGLCYYAGHGLSIKGVNYFMPVDANPKSEDEVEFEGLPANRLIRKMEENNRLTNIILFDACRDNPFARSWGRTLDETGGFALLPPPRGTLIAYAASDGEKAADAGRSKTNSPFASAFVKYVQQGGLSISQILLHVRREVEEVTNERQTTEEINKLRNDFYFK